VPVLDGTYTPPEPAVLARADGLCLLYPSKVHSVFGESESLKSWLCQYAAVQEIGAGHHVAYIDFEDDEGSVVSRLLAMGAKPDAVRRLFLYIRPAGPLAAGGAEAAALYSLAASCSLVVLDGVSEAMVLHGQDPDKGTRDAAQFLDLLPRPLAAAGPAVVMIDHIGKGALPGTKNALGAQHKRAGINGASYSVTVTKPFGYGLHGEAVIRVAKDRPGRVRGFAAGHDRDEVGVLHLDSMADRKVRALLEPAASGADSSASGSNGWRPTALMEKVSRYVEATPGASMTAIEKGVPGKGTYVRQALTALVEDGYAHVIQQGQARLHTSVRPFREDGGAVPGGDADPPLRKPVITQYPPGVPCPAGITRSDDQMTALVVTWPDGKLEPIPEAVTPSSAEAWAEAEWARRRGES
jgi:hypothetical protein